MRGRPTVVVTVLVLLSSVLPSTAWGQERKGFWFEVGGGVGFAEVAANNLEGERDKSGVGYFELGWAVSPKLLVGFELRTIEESIQGDVTGALDIYNASAIFAYYPRAASGFFVKGGVGGSFLDLAIEAQGTTLTANIAKGLGLSAGAGYDVYLGRGWSLAPAVGFWYGRLGDVRFLGETLLTDWSHNVIDMTISIKFN